MTETDTSPDELGAASCSGFLTAEQIRIGSWWAAADGEKYGCVVLSVNLKTKDATVLGTDGKQREIDTFKLQYRYGHCIPNSRAQSSAGLTDSTCFKSTHG
jgi:hypothetical protein